MAASSSAQIHGLGTPSFAGSLKKTPNSRTLFLGQRLNSTPFPRSAFLKLNSTSRRRRHYPLRVVNEKVVGIDLGTTNSAVAAMDGGGPTSLSNAAGQRTSPS
ncbi:hypothetical protein EI013_25875, partial [Escherichia coli]|nr:hypothetical protein [Escherichia coli]